MGIGLLLLSGCAGESSGDSTPAPKVSTEEPSSAPGAEAAALLKDFEGKSCDGDELIMEQGDESLYCDLDANGSLVWVTAATHKVLLEEAQAKAQAKAEAEAKARAKVEADAKAEAQAKAEKEAAAVAKRIKEEKAAAEKKELTITKAAPQTSAAKPSIQGFVAPKPQPKATPTPKPKASPKPKPTPTPKSSGSAYYKNCSAVRAAGKAPIYVGEPGYSRKLDRDGDGVACE